MSKLYYGDSEVLKWYDEEDQIMKAYYGDTLMFGYEGEEPTPPTPIPNYLQFTAVNGAATIGMSGSATPNVSYSFDGTNWTTWNYSNLTIPSGSTVYMKGNNPNGLAKKVGIGYATKKFTMSGTIEANGNIMSLLYEDNFEGQLTIPSESVYCFGQLFYGCTSLTSAPELPATTLAEYCYQYMFRNCSSLNYIKMMATDISATSCLQLWVRDVAATGTFVKNSAAQWDVSGNSGVPSGWTIEYASS